MEIQKSQFNAETIGKILKEISEIKKQLAHSQSIGDWITRQQAMSFLGYQNTTMRELEKSGKLSFSQVGRKKFIRKQAIIDFLNRNVQL
jgi:hypothetical protein